MSGLSDHDYPNLAAQGVGLEALKHFSVTKKIPIPPELREHHGSILLFCVVPYVGTLHVFLYTCSCRM